MEQKIKCNVSNCEHCDCEKNCCELNEIKVCNCDCSCACEVTDTMCSNFKEKDN